MKKWFEEGADISHGVISQGGALDGCRKKKVLIQKLQGKALMVLKMMEIKTFPREGSLFGRDADAVYHTKSLRQVGGSDSRLLRRNYFYQITFRLHRSF